MLSLWTLHGDDARLCHIRAAVDSRCLALAAAPSAAAAALDCVERGSERIRAAVHRDPCPFPNARRPAVAGVVRLPATKGGRTSPFPSTPRASAGVGSEFLPVHRLYWGYVWFKTAH